MNLSFQEKYDIIGTKSAAYEGAFITAVKTTGIFCRPSCRARKPKEKNVVFYDNIQQALQNGYRPCKVCKPLEQPGETPAYIQQIIKELQDQPALKIKDQGLRDRGVEPSQIRRWFKKHHGITFHTYQRMLRINAAYAALQKGKSVTDTAFSSGYESLSGFNDSYRTVFGTSPIASKGKNIIHLRRFATPIGPMFACATSEGICLLEFTDRRMLETEFKDLCKRLNAVILPGANPLLDQVQKEVLEYMDGQRTQFEVPIHAPGTDFQQAVWKLLQSIPYGHTRTYKEQAILLQKPKAIRAVARANGYNRISLIIPCHRVLGSDGQLTGYGGGLPRKQWLLDLESKH